MLLEHEGGYVNNVHDKGGMTLREYTTSGLAESLLNKK